MSHRGVGLVVTDSARGRLYLQQKDDDYAPHPRGWSFFGGAIDAGESPREAMVRELREEWQPEAVAAIDPRQAQVVFEGQVGGRFPFTLFHLAVDGATLEALAAHPVREGLRGALIPAADALELDWIWGLGQVARAFLE